MGIPTSYTEDQVKEFMEKVLGKTGKKLELSVANDSFDEPAYEVLFVLGESDFSFATTQEQIKKIRLVARMEAWRAATYETAHEASHSVGAPGTGQTSRADIHRHCLEMLEKAQAELSQTFPELVIGEDSSWGVERIPVSYDGDYYSNAGESAE